MVCSGAANRCHYRLTDQTSPHEARDTLRMTQGQPLRRFGIEVDTHRFMPYAFGLINLSTGSCRSVSRFDCETRIKVAGCEC